MVTSASAALCLVVPDVVEMLWSLLGFVDDLMILEL